MISSKGFGATSADSDLALLEFSRRDPGETDIQMEILFCGVCHSDLHQVRNEWGGTNYPIVPGHEIIGRVTFAGTKVSKFKVGDIAAVGCMVDSCRNCDHCRTGQEPYCQKGVVWTYGSLSEKDKEYTKGGYSNNFVVDEAFALRVPENLDLASAAPLLCAGITTWSPLQHWKVGPGKRVGIVGLGGLGHMAIKFASALGAQVTLFTTSPGKAEDARRMGADDVVLSKDESAMAAHAGQYDFILNTVAAKIPLDPYLNLLRLDGALVLVGLPNEPLPVNAFSLAAMRRSVAGSMIGGIRETQEMLDYCGQRGITCDVEVISMSDINEAYERMLRSDVKYRFVIDMATLQ